MKFATISLAAGVAVLASGAQAQTSSFENVQTSVQYGWAWNSSEDKALGYGADSKHLETLRFHNENHWALGNSSILVDWLHSSQALGGNVFGPDDHANYQYGPGDSTYFGVAEVELTASRTLPWKAQGPLSDVGLSARVERGGYYRFHAFELGPRVHLDVPGFDNFSVAAWYRQKSDISGSAGQQGYDVGTRRNYLGSWLLGLDLKSSWAWVGHTWTTQTFVRYQLGRGGKAAAQGSENINGIPNRVWIEPDLFVNLAPHVAVGVRDYYLWQSDAIDNGYSTTGNHSHHVMQAVMKAYF
jgi:hypothetical protein